MPKIALVYDRVNKIGGAEKVLQALHQFWPEAPLYTSVYNQKTALWAKNFKIKTSFLQKFPWARSHHQYLAPLMPMVFASFDFSGFDVVISVTSAEAKAIKIPPGCLHICYCLTPTRYLWSGKKIYEKQGLKGFFLKLLAPIFRQWDFKTAQNPKIMIAISQTVKKRIKKYYQRDSQVIYPPVSINKKRFKPLGNNLNIPRLSQEGTPGVVMPEKFYLIVSRLVKYKQVDLALRAFKNYLPDKKLVVVGVGEESCKLRKKAGQNTIFTGQLTDGRLVSYYEACRALIFPGEEDFGITALEAQLMGKPVIAFKKGGVKETVIEGKTGCFFAKPTAKSLAKAIKNFEKRIFLAKDCHTQAQKFSKKVFLQKFKKIVEGQCLTRQKSQ